MDDDDLKINRLLTWRPWNDCGAGKLKRNHSLPSSGFENHLESVLVIWRSLDFLSNRGSRVAAPEGVCRESFSFGPLPILTFFLI